MFNASPLELVESDFYTSHGIQLFIKRDDLIHPLISGNKWRKLKYNIATYQKTGKSGILTFGGAFSNHLVATAAACHALGIPSVGIVRGDELTSTSNETLRQCSNFGMELNFVSRADYNARNEKSYQEVLLNSFPNFMVIPEGGANYLGLVGCQEIMGEIDQPFEYVFVAQGTSTTSCGILTALKEEQKLHVVPALKGYKAREEMRTLMLEFGFESAYIDELLTRVTVHDAYHHGGYGKTSPELLYTIRKFYRDFGIKVDPIYTGKVLYAIHDLIHKKIVQNSRVLFVHTGGVQGATGIEQKTGVSLFDGA